MRTPEQTNALVPPSDRSAQRFPRLSRAQLAIAERFSITEPKIFQPGEYLYKPGDLNVPSWFLLSGSVENFGRDGLDQETIIQHLEAGQFTGELNQLGEHPCLAGARTGPDGAVAFPLQAEQLRALVVGSAELGEMIMRAFILRRVNLLERGLGPVILARAGTADVLRIQDFLTRNTYPHFVLDYASERGRELLDVLKLPDSDLPLLVCPCGQVLKRPTNEEVGAWLGITPNLQANHIYDVAVVGSGPAGLATAVYAASEGLSVLVVDGLVLGGQAGASARIENYLGFPTGISGRALTGRALSQAQKFGAQVAIPLAARSLDCGGPDFDTVQLSLSDGSKIEARSVVIASGARYKRPEIENLQAFEGDCIHYWASPVEAKGCADQHVALVGAGNSAGQAVAFLAPQVKRLTMIVRGEGLEASMSRYLIDRIRSFDNVDLRIRSEIAGLRTGTDDGLDGIGIRNRVTGTVDELAARYVFMFIGAEPNTAWLNGAVALDNKGYVLTGLSRADGSSAPLSLQTSLPRVFAIGDVRSGSTKRLAYAVGEGAAVVTQIHALLARPLNPGLRLGLFAPTGPQFLQA
jgi:thioredoxin reductase (NADPH)